MPWSFTPYSLPLLLAVAVSTALGVYAWRRRHRISYGTTFALLVFASAFWSAGYFLELSGGDLPTKLFWAKAQYAAIASILPLVLIFVLRYAGLERFLTKLNLALLAAFAATTFGLVVTNESHHLIWSSVSLVTDGPIKVLALEHGLWFWLQAVAGGLMFAVSLGVLVKSAANAALPYRRQAYVLVLGLLLPPLAGLAYLTGYGPVARVDFAPFTFAISAGLFTVGVFRFQLLELVPVARHTVVDRMTDAVLVLDEQGRIIDLNPAAENVLSLKAPQVIGNRAERALGRWPELLARLKNGEAEQVIALGEGNNARFYSLVMSPMHKVGGRPDLRLIVLRDINERVEAGEALRQSEEKFRKIFLTSTDSIAISDVHEGTILDVNEGFLRNTGYSRDEVVGKPSTQLGIWAKEGSREEVIGRLLAGEEVRDVQLQFRVKDGSLRTGLFSAQILDLGGQPRLLSVTKDITEYKRLEEQLYQAQKMDALGTLAGGIAHDFNNQLTVILGNAAFLLDALPPDDPLRPDVESIRQAGELATALTSQILTFSRRQVIEPAIVNLNTIILETARMLERVIGQDVKLILDLTDNLGPVRADPNQIKQALVNLSANARDAMPDGGRLTIRTSNVEVDAAHPLAHPEVAPGRHVLLSVADTGIGMTSEVKERIFEPFFTTKQAGQGTGLGLSVVYGIVQQIGGTIVVHSEPGHGSEFDIYLPLAADAAGWMTERPVEAPSGKGETLLLIEDDEIVRDIAKRILERHGYRVLAAETGEDALRLCQENLASIDLLLTDVVMPDMGGEELGRRVRELRPGVRVLYMSGYFDSMLLRHDRQVQEDFLQKPFKSEDLLRKVRDVLDGPARSLPGS